jgi:hypothetical protein
MIQKLKNTRDTFSRPPKLLKTLGIIGVLYQLILSAFLPGENMANDEYHTMWRGIYLPTIQCCLIGSKVLQLCRLMSGYVLEFMVYSGAGSDIATNL